MLTNSSRHNPNCVMSWIIAHCNNPANKNSIIFFIFHQINRQNIFQDLFFAPALFFNPAFWSKPNLFLNLIFQSWFVKQSKWRIDIYHRIVYWFFYFSIAFVFVQFSFDPYIPPPTIFLILFFGFLFKVIRAWQRPIENNNRNERTKTILRLDFHFFCIDCFDRLECVNATIFQYAIIFLFNRWRDFYSQIVGDFNCCFDQFWIFETCHCRWRLFLQ